MITLAQIDELNGRFGVADAAQIVAGNGGMPKVVVAAASATAEIYLHGAQVTAWRPAGTEEVIFLSQHSLWQEGIAIRGGIPICFPWFGPKDDDPHAPSHGFVRNKEWLLDSIAAEADGTVVVSCSTQSDEQTLHAWPHAFRLTHRVTIGRTLKLELIASNIGDSPFQITEALHTYFKVGDAASARVHGLDQVPYLDKTDHYRPDVQVGDVVFHTTVDNAYPDTHADCALIDPALRRTVRIVKHNSASTIVWNPGKKGAAALNDLGDEEWREMVCVEAGNIRGSAISLEPGQEHTMQAILSIEPH